MSRPAPADAIANAVLPYVFNANEIANETRKISQLSQSRGKDKFLPYFDISSRSFRNPSV